MTRIELRFTPANLGLLAAGLKLATVRRERHAVVGDTFEALQRTWRITAVVPMALGDAFRHLYPLEGFDSSEEFFDSWVASYELVQPPDLNQGVYAHYFIGQA